MVDEYLKVLGTHFRGLWVVHIYTDEEEKVVMKWAATIQIGEQSYDTQYQESADDAMKQAATLFKRLDKKRISNERKMERRKTDKLV